MEITTRYKTKTELIQYLHACCFSLTERTFLKATKNENFLTWPGLNNQKLLKHMPPSFVPSQRHMYQDRQKKLSTKHLKSEG